MRYQHLKTSRKVTKILLPIVPLLIAAILLGTQAQMPSFLTNVGHAIAKPFWTGRDNAVATVATTFDSLDSKEELLQKNKALEEELAKLRRESFMANILMRENENLREIVGRTDSESSRIPATIIHNDTFSPYDSFIIDIGTTHGVRDGMLVISPEGIAIGTIRNTLAHSAVATSFTASGMVVDVILHATTSMHTQVFGYGGGTMHMSIPRDIEVSIGDIVALPSFATRPLGNVASIQIDPEDAYKMIYISTPVNIYELRHVLVDTTQTWTAPDIVLKQNEDIAPSSD